jgi:APA family basic amino acid/polyamine antiporter
MRIDPFRIKTVSSEVPSDGPGLKRVLGPFDLTMLGIGGIIGAGIFALVGSAAAGRDTSPGAGPALIVSFLLTAVGCSFAALCYAEFASVARVSGSAYSYAYATLGELVAWIIGWDLVLEYAVGNIAVAVSWSGYFQDLINPFLHALHTRYPDWVVDEFPKWLGSDIHTALRDAALVEGKVGILDSAPRLFGVPIVFNLPAVFIVAAITGLLVVGIKESSRFNAAMVGIKLAVLGFFVVVGSFYVKPENFHPFMPNGWSGIQAGAAVVFFAYIGFDAVSTAAEECRNPRRDLPIGILGSLAICAVIYMVVAAVLTGMSHYENFRDVNEPLSVAMREVHLPWAAGIVACGSVVAHTAVLLVFQLGQPRILYAMARDRLLPRVMAKTHPRFRTPHVATILTGLFVAVGSAISSLPDMADLCSIGTLSAFIIVCAGVLVLRWREPGRTGGFRTPWVPWVPLLGIASCLWLACGLPRVAWIRFFVWLGAGLVLYVCYGIWRNRAGEASHGA